MLSKLTQNTKQFVTDNATTILTAVGVTGTATTGVLGYRAGFRSANLIHDDRTNRQGEYDIAREESIEDIPRKDVPDLNRTEAFKLIWPEFVPPVGACTLTMASILFSHKMNAGRAATLAAAYSASKSKYEEYRDKVAAQIGVDEEEALNKEVEFVYMDGEALFLDQMTGRYFKSSMLDIKTAENTVNHEILTHGFASLGMFYDEIGLPSTDVTEDLGWNSDMLVEVHLGSEITPEGKPAIVLSFVTVPKHDYR